MIPKVWDDASDEGFRTAPFESAVFLRSTFLRPSTYQIPVRPIYKLYPVCHPDREPKGVLVQREMESGRTPLVF